MTAWTESCPFCKLVRDPLSLLPEFELTDGVLRFPPLNPVVPGHMLFVPRQHVQHAGEESSVTSRVFGIAAHYTARFPDQAFNLITSAGTAASQTIHHLHVHYVPRRPDDGLLLPWTNQYTEGTPE